MSKDYDILLFGITGFTGKLAAEILLRNGAYDLKWGGCARNAAKATAILADICKSVGDVAPPAVEVADLVCADAAAEDKLRAVVKKTKVVITTAGPFEKYGVTLIKLCAEEGVHYADITGESDFFRAAVLAHDAAARKSGAVVVPHCGNDCVPWDLTVLKMHEAAAAKGATLKSCATYTEFAASMGMSGGTLTTAVYQLGKSRGAKPSFDPLLTDAAGAKSRFSTLNKSPKSDVKCAEFGRSGGPWIMGPVMANCVRRSNALLGYAPELVYAEQQLRDPSLMNRVKETAFSGLVACAVAAPSVFAGFLPKPGEGPKRSDMEAGWLRVHGRAELSDGSKLKSTFEFGEDTGYLGTARMLVECGYQLATGATKTPGVVTPAAAFGSALLERLEAKTPTKWSLEEEGCAPPGAGGC